jgi:hypothetical protein
VRTLAVLLLLTLAPSVAVSVASAQSDALPTQDPSAYRFYRAPGRSFVTVDDAQVVGDLTPYLDVTLDYAHQPFRIVDLAYYTGSASAPVPTGAHTDIVGGMFTTQLTGAIAIARRVQIGLNVPIIAFETGDSFRWQQANPTGGVPLPRSIPGGSASMIGDPRLHVLVSFVDAEETGWLGIAAAAWITAPIAHAMAPQHYSGDPTVAAGGHLVVSAHIEHFRVAINVGGAFHDAQQLIYSRRTSEMTYGAAASYDFDTMWSAMAEITGATTFGLSFDDEAPTEIRAAGLMHIDDFTLHLGIGAGIAYAIGVPVVRATLGGSWSPTVARDSDGDGIRDDVDACPSEREDADGRLDEDGCPEDDDDEDGVSDANDRCPDEAEDIDQHEDDDGCPDPDDDHDGILDGYDSCPSQPEDRDGDRDDDGCPDTDRDRDGVQDVNDACPDQPEDTDGLADEDGCPEDDADHDGIRDENDECADVPEDVDRFQDRDGCPEEGGRPLPHAPTDTTDTAAPTAAPAHVGAPHAPAGGARRHHRRRPR